MPNSDRTSAISKQQHTDERFMVADMCNKYLEYAESRVAEGNLTQRSFRDYQDAAKAICHAFGQNRSADEIRPADFDVLRRQVSAGRRPKTVSNWITRCKVIIKFANDNELTSRPIRFGTYFDKPAAAIIRRDRKQQAHRGNMDLQANQIRDLLEIACPQLYAMILLGINVGIGNADLGRIRFDDFDLETGWLDYSRWKTEVHRRAKLWPETINAIRKSIAVRPEPETSDLDNTVFITKLGKSWHKESSVNPISQAFRKLLKDTDHHVYGVGFYALRRTFETVAAETKDQPAIDLSMGHESPDMASLYRQRLGDKRLEAVAEHVRQWLFG